MKARAQEKMIGIVLLDGLGHDVEIAVHHESQKSLFILVRDVFGGGFPAMTPTEPRESCLAARVLFWKLQVVLECRAAQRHFIV